MHTIQNAIDGSKLTSSSRRIAPVYNPATGEQTAEPAAFDRRRGE